VTGNLNSLRERRRLLQEKNSPISSEFKSIGGEEKGEEAGRHQFQIGNVGSNYLGGGGGAFERTGKDRLNVREKG